MSDEVVKRFKRLYLAGKISEADVRKMLDAGKITEEQYREICESNE